MFRLYIFLMIAFVAGARPDATAADYTAPAGMTILTEEQLLNQIIGNTFMGGTKWVEYYEPPTDDLKKEKIKGHLKGYGLYNAIWTIKGAQMCWQYKKDTWPGSWGGCFTVALDGDTVNRYKANGEVHVWRGNIKKLVPGNPKNL